MTRIKRAVTSPDVFLFESTAQKHAARVRELFDRKAASWSEKYEAGGPLTGRVHVFLSAVRDCARPPARILDLGCGTGEIARALREDGYTVVACDTSPTMMGIARRQTAAIDQTLHWVDLDEDWSRLPFDAGSFDVVVASSVLEYMANLEICLAEVKRVLLASGVFLATVPNPDHSQRKLEMLASRVALLPMSTVAKRISPRLANYVTYLQLSRNRFSAGEWSRLAATVGLRLRDASPPCVTLTPSLQMLHFRAGEETS